MKITGIICEYNPLHLGHKKQLDAVKEIQGADSATVCVMSGNFVQRGAPAIVDKLRRAKAAVLCGADLVLELPVTACLSSAEGFAAGGVSALSPFCNSLCFGAETADGDALMDLARALLSPGFPELLRAQLDIGLSFPAARQAALEQAGMNASVLSMPNNILAVEYCKAILSQGASMEILPIHRAGSYHDIRANGVDPSATAVRALMTENQPWQGFVPVPAQGCIEDAPLHTLAAGERAILARLRCMTEAEFEALPYGSEGLWRKLMHAVRQQPTLEDILTAVKSKRYTRSRLDRMVMCAFLGITGEQLTQKAPYVRVLAFNEKGRQILKVARESGSYPNIGQKQDHPYQTLEDRCDDLYGLFAHPSPEPPGAQRSYRVYSHK